MGGRSRSPRRVGRRHLSPRRRGRRPPGRTRSRARGRAPARRPTVRRSSSTWSRSTRQNTLGLPARSRAAKADGSGTVIRTPHDGSVVPGIEPPPTDGLASVHVRVLEVAADRLGQQPGAPLHRRRPARAACVRRAPRACAPRHGHREHLLERRRPASCRRGRRARSGGARSRATRSRPPDDDARPAVRRAACRPSTSRGRRRRRARRRTAGSSGGMPRLVPQQARSPRRRGTARRASGERGELGGRRGGREPDDAVVRRMDLAAPRRRGR